MDKETFWNLLNGYQSNMYRFALSILKNPQEAEDAVHDVMIKLWHYRKKLPSEDKKRSGFVFKTVKNFCIDRLRKRKNLVAIEPFHLISEQKAVYEDQHLIDQIRYKLSELPLKQRMVIELKDFLGYSYEEIESILEVPVPTLRVYLSRARKYLINELAYEKKEIR